MDNATFKSFFSFLLFISFLIAALSLVHIAVLHQDGSGNPLGVESSVDKIAMYPYFIIKDCLGLIILDYFCKLCLFLSKHFGPSR